MSKGIHKGGCPSVKKYIAAALLLLLAYFGWTQWESRQLHHSIQASEVSEVSMWGEGVPEHAATTKEVRQLVEWFNASTDIRDNSALSGTTPSAGIRMKLQDGHVIYIFASGSDFEVERDDVNRRVAYWARQPEIKALLQSLAVAGNK
jgi:hypothetical protein